MSAYNDAAYLAESIDSVLAQTERDFEFIIVNDGAPDPRTGEILADYARRDRRIRVITKPNEGLTKALVDGCAAAKGKYIARIDVGDVMIPDRLRRQKVVLDRHPDAVLATCWAEFCGPNWEYLYTVKDKALGTVEDGCWVADVLPNQIGDNLLAGPNHHGSVIFRTDAYRAAGGYRWQFYYSQDKDLWYRLAEQGKLAGVRQTLYRCRVFPDGISMRNTTWQQRIYECCVGAAHARRQGESEEVYLKNAAAIRPQPCPAPGSQYSLRTSAVGHYFVGEALRKNKDRRCRAYFLRALRLFPFHVRAWIRLVQSFLIRR